MHVSNYNDRPPEATAAAQRTSIVKTHACTTDERMPGLHSGDGWMVAAKNFMPVPETATTSTYEGI